MSRWPNALAVLQEALRGSCGPAASIKILSDAPTDSPDSFFLGDDEPEVAVLLMTTHAGMALNLQAAHRLILMEPCADAFGAAQALARLGRKARDPELPPPIVTCLDMRGTLEDC